MAHIGFKKLVNKISHEKHPPTDVKAVVAAVGRKKLGKKAFQKKAAEGRHEAAERRHHKGK